MDLLERGTKKVRREVTNTLHDLRHLLTGGVSDVVKRARGTTVLVYHGVVPTQPFRFNSRFITTERFSHHLKLFVRHCHVLTFEEFQNGQADRDRLNVLITFDDGYRNNYEHALPELTKLGVPATFFVCGLPVGHWLLNDVLDLFALLGPKRITIGSIPFLKSGSLPRYRNEKGETMQQLFFRYTGVQKSELFKELFSVVPKAEFSRHNDYLELLNEKQLRDIANIKGLTVGSHTLSHPDLSDVDRSTALRELSESKKRIETITGKSCSAVAFPYGRYKEETITIGQESGYKYFFGTEFSLPGTDLQPVTHRLTVNPYISAVNELRCISLGSHE